MRNMITLTMAGTLLLSVSSCKNKMKINDTLVPEAVNHTFHSRYPKADKTEWLLDQGIYEAHFHVGGEAKTAAFKGDGSFVEGN